VEGAKMKSDTFRINYAQNPDLKEFFGRQNPGDTVELTVRFQVKSVDADEVSGSLTEVELPEEEKAEGEGEGEGEGMGSVMPDAMAPAAMMMKSTKEKQA
jgi:hypothetical protein